MAYNLPSVQMPDIAGGMAAGYQRGAAIREDKRRQPILAQLDALKVKQQEQAVDMSKKNMTISDLKISDAKRQQDMAELAIIKDFAGYADTPEKWEEGLNFLEQQGRPVAAFRNQFHMRDMLLSLDPNQDIQKQVERFTDPKIVIDSTTGKPKNVRYGSLGSRIEEEDLPYTSGQKSYDRTMGDLQAKLEKATDLAQIKKIIAEHEKEGQIAAELSASGDVAASAAEKARRTEQAKSQQKAADEAFKTASGLDSQLRQLDRAIEALDEGAETGIVASSLPSFKKATIQLEEAAKNLGIEVINSATFGALSENELKLALSTAIPQNLDEDDLREYLFDKRTAMAKLSNEIKKMGMFLSKEGNTLDKWYEKQEQKRTSDTSQQSSATPPTNQKGWSLMTDAQGNKAYVSPDGTQFEEVK